MAALDSPATATFSWTKENVEAAGRVHYFRASVAAREGEPPDGFALMTGREATVVVEMWPARP